MRVSTRWRRFARCSESDDPSCTDTWAGIATACRLGRDKKRLTREAGRFHPSMVDGCACVAADWP